MCIFEEELFVPTQGVLALLIYRAQRSDLRTCNP